ncbi:MAG: pyrroline-5-carboxylate reductase [Pirellulales bacterium]|nr:pyrroline-5-carboxylate reductase [Pirellulales bacterium]
MATALAGGLASARVVSSDQIAASDVSPEALAAFVGQTGGRAVASNRELVAGSDVIVLSVKPQMAAGVMSEIAEEMDESKLLVSIVAGLPLAALARELPGGRLVRVMPNTPCLIGAGASAFSLGRGTTADDGQLVQQLMSAVGTCLSLDERLMDAVTGLSGSGPAFVYAMIEAMSDGGVKAGLPRVAATQLAAATVAGAARMVMETGEHPGALKDQVTSPAGTTIAGLAELENRGLRGALIEAVNAAAGRAGELAEQANAVQRTSK